MTTDRRLDDGQLDRLLRAALTLEADRAVGGQPDLEVAVSRLANRVTSGGPSRRSVFQPHRPAAIMWAALLVAALAAAAVVGSILLRETDRPPSIEARPFGLGSPCRVAIDADVIAEVRWGTHDNPQEIEYRRTGSVTQSGMQSMGTPDPERPREAMVTGTFVTERRLVPAGLQMVEQRIAADVPLPPGCYTLRTWEAEGQLAANTPAGPILLVWSRTAGEHSLARLATGAENETLRYLADALARPESWLPDDAFVGGMGGNRPKVHDRWLVHTVLERTDYAPDAVLAIGDGAPVSATDGRYGAVVLPDDATLETFGTPLQSADASRPRATQRCAEIVSEDALALARSLDSVAIGVAGEADLYSPDMSIAIFVSLLPAGPGDDCAALEADLRTRSEPDPVATPAVLGDLAAIDPCTLVPDDLRGPVDPGYRWEDPGFGLAANRCVLVHRASFGAALERETLWLYPWTIAEADAPILAQAVLGDRVSETTIDGHPAWQNQCLMGEATCVGAIAAWEAGRFLVLEVLDDTMAPSELRARAQADLNRILASD